MLAPQVAQLVDALREWASQRVDIVGVALVGSHARAAAGPDSDVDFVVVTTTSESYRAGGWPAQIKWPAGDEVQPHWIDVTYGALWARHLELASGTRVEVGFAAPAWTQTDPVDPGTAVVVGGGWVVVWDPTGILAGLRCAVEASAARDPTRS
jgi:hypothetical protein